MLQVPLFDQEVNSSLALYSVEVEVEEVEAVEAVEAAVFEVVLLFLTARIIRRFARVVDSKLKRGII